MRIAYISNTNPSNINNWSGTTEFRINFTGRLKIKK